MIQLRNLAEPLYQQLHAAGKRLIREHHARQGVDEVGHGQQRPALHGEILPQFRFGQGDFTDKLYSPIQHVNDVFQIVAA